MGVYSMLLLTRVLLNAVTTFPTMAMRTHNLRSVTKLPLLIVVTMASNVKWMSAALMKPIAPRLVMTKCTMSATTCVHLMLIVSVSQHTT